MGLFSRWTTASADQFEDVFRRLIARHAATDPIVEGDPAVRFADLIRAGLDGVPILLRLPGVVMVRSPVLTLQRGILVQPVSLIPAPMLGRFWAGLGRAVWTDPSVIPWLASLAHGLAANDKLAGQVLRDVADVYVDPSAPMTRWPDQDQHLALASLILADAARKLAAGFTREDVAGSLRPGGVEAARPHLERMMAEEEPWYAAAIAR